MSHGVKVWFGLKELFKVSSVGRRRSRFGTLADILFFFLSLKIIQNPGAISNNSLSNHPMAGPSLLPRLQGTVAKRGSGLNPYLTPASFVTSC